MRKPFRDDEFFFSTLQIDTVPSSPTLRQRFDMAAPKSGWESVLLEESARLLHEFNVTVSPAQLGKDKERSYVPLDIDVSPFDNSGQRNKAYPEPTRDTTGTLPFLLILDLKTMAYTSKDTEADFIIKRNLRRESPKVWFLTAQRYGMCCEARPGKKIYRGSILSPMKRLSEPVRMVFEVIERTSTRVARCFSSPRLRSTCI